MTLKKRYFERAFWGLLLTFAFTVAAYGDLFPPPRNFFHSARETVISPASGGLFIALLLIITSGFILLWLYLDRNSWSSNMKIFLRIWLLSTLTVAILSLGMYLYG